MIRFALDALTGSARPRSSLPAMPGCSLSLGSILIILYIGYAFVTGQNIQGGTSLMLVVVVLGAVQMFVLAMMGEYIGRLYGSRRPPPLYRAGYCGRGAHSAQEPRSGARRRDRQSDRPGGSGTLPINRAS